MQGVQAESSAGAAAAILHLATVVSERFAGRGQGVGAEFIDAAAEEGKSSDAGDGDCQSLECGDECFVDAGSQFRDLWIGFDFELHEGDDHTPDGAHQSQHGCEGADDGQVFDAASAADELFGGGIFEGFSTGGHIPPGTSSRPASRI